MKKGSSIIYLAVCVVIMACRGTVDSVVYGDNKTGVFVNFINDNGGDIDQYVTRVTFYKRSKNINKMNDIYWEIGYRYPPDMKMNKDLQRHHIIQYGVAPKGYEVLHPMKKLGEHQKYYYSVEAGIDATSGCFYIVDNKVVDLSGTDC